jgi:hypothetical protein
MHGVLRTGGEQVELACAHGWLSAVLEEGAAGELARPDGTRPDVRVTVEDTTRAFDTAGWELMTRGAWRRPGRVIVRDACSSGLDLLVTAAGPTLDVVARWRPTAAGRAAAAVLRSRSRLLLRAVLLQYPVLWWSQRRGCAPLHASVCSITGSDIPNGSGGTGQPAVLIAGPGGLGKSTLVNAELDRGGLATCDNLCVSDGSTAWGVVEPRRLAVGDRDRGQGHDHSLAELAPWRGVEGGSSPLGLAPHGRRMPHGRREAPWLGRADGLVPDCVLILRRGEDRSPTVAPCAPRDAELSLVAGTYMAGELRRYWAFAATLALGTGAGDIHPTVAGTAATLCARLPCLRVTLADRPGTPLGALVHDWLNTEVRA